MELVIIEGFRMAVPEATESHCLHCTNPAVCYLEKHHDERFSLMRDIPNLHNDRL